MGIPIIQEILDIIRTVITTATSTIGHVIGSSPPIFKLIMFLFLITFVGGTLMNYSIGLYFVCDGGTLYKPNGVFDALQVKYVGWSILEDSEVDYCGGDISTSRYCGNYDGNKPGCDAVCPGDWDNSSQNCREWGGYVNPDNWFVWVCAHWNEVNCTYVDGCYWVTSEITQQEYSEAIEEHTTLAEVDLEALHIGCGGDFGNDVSLFVGKMDLFAWETALALVLLTVFFGVWSFVKNN